MESLDDDNPRGITHRAGAGGRSESEPAPRDGETLESARLRAVEPWTRLRFLGWPGLDAGGFPTRRGLQSRHDREPSHRGQSAVVSPRNRDAFRARWRVGAVG